jgi:hypothetical protein
MNWSIVEVNGCLVIADVLWPECNFRCLIRPSVCAVPNPLSIRTPHLNLINYYKYYFILT